ncbi:MAG TPA: helix-turn-helix domain-containing protein [Intrasporangium sp.]|uniref:PucR family transcriptional regulator n=1 Tax=Intrasporangium sp. TaxID=1925024 RepID=UPI002D79F41A|nr:helix-turn-helix domain-containing protein [Intrasporangium sp.]HET7399707.1 helix-turn-helix domain-containing protein [Intrasporangium sp.]
MTETGQEPPWLSLPAEISVQLRPAFADVVEEIISTIPHTVPDYALPMEGRFGQGIRQGVGVALDRFLDLPGTRLPALSEDSKWIYERLGRGEVRAGRSLESLLAAYRAGARVTFRAISRSAAVADLTPDVLLALGESLFAYIDELSAASAQGYALEQSERAGEQQRLRGELVEAVLRGDVSEGTVARLAAAVGWTLPEVVVVATVPSPHVEGLRASLGPDALVAERGTDVVVLMPFVDRPARRRTLARALEGRRAIVGPPRPLGLAAESLHLAVAAGARGLAPGDLLEPGPAVWVEEHLAELIVLAEPLATADLAARVLAPLDRVRPAVRERLAETLLSWLRHSGQRTPIAGELFVHQQTVGYRVAQLKELFGEALEDPEVRFELELVLRAGHR